MALPDLTQLKAYLRVETTTEDSLLTAILARAGAAVRTYLDRPIESDDRTYRIEGDTDRAFPEFTKLLIPDYPLDPESVVITDENGDPVDPTTYTVDGATGVIRADAGTSFAAFPYEVSASVGLEEASDYTTRVEPLIASAILDYAAELYQHRNPGARQESELGVSTSYGGDALPPRIATTICSLRRA